MALATYKFGITVRHSDTGLPWGACPSVELHKGSTVLTLSELGTSAFYVAAAVPAGKWALWVNSLDTGMSFPVGDGELAGLGYSNGKLLGSTGDAIYWMDAGNVAHFHVHIQGAASSVWSVAHNLGRKPSVALTTSTGDEFDGQIQHIDDNNLNVILGYAISGHAHCV